MFNNKKRIVIWAALMVLLFTGQAMAQTKVLGFQLGKDTYKQVKANLPQAAKITNAYANAYTGGPGFVTDGTGYGVEELRVVKFEFDKNQKLADVNIVMESRRLNDLKKILSSKYKLGRSEYPEIFLLFKANRDYVYLYLPQDNEFAVRYMTGAVYLLNEQMVRQSAAKKKTQELENLKALDREALQERDKF